MKKVENIEELNEEFKGIKTVVAGDTRFTAQAILYLCEKMDELIATVKPRPKRPLSDWQCFMAQCMREGKSIQEAGRLWRERKEK